jgi:hypothetical protein
MASGATAVQPGGASGSAAPLSGADAALLVQLRTRKGVPVALLRAGHAARPTEDEARSGAQAVGAVLQCPALLAAVFVFLEPADLCAVALVCDAWSLVRWRACTCFGPHDQGAAWAARAPCGPGLVHLRPGSALARKGAVAEAAISASRLLIHPAGLSIWGRRTRNVQAYVQGKVSDHSSTPGFVLFTRPSLCCW